MTKKIIYVLIFFQSILAASQTDVELLKNISLEVCESKPLFCKAYNYYNLRLYDSCYVYSGKALLTSNNYKEKDILNYIQGISAIKKNLYKKALKNILSIRDNSFIESLKESQLGNIYLNLKQYDNSIKHYLIWEGLDNVKDSKITKNAYHNIGLSYIHLKDYDSAKQYFDKEFSLIKKSDTSSIIRAKMDLANVYYNQYLDDDAIPLFLESYNLAKSFTDIELKQNSALNMAVVERNRKGYRESVQYYREYIKWKDSLWNRDKIWELTEKDKQIAVAQKDSEIAIQEEKLKTQKVVQKGLIFGASGLLVFLGFLAFFYKKLQKKNSLITQQKEDLTIANKTKNYLFSVVSHDLRSPMNTIKHQHLQLKKHIENNNLEGIKEANNSAITVTESTSHLLNNVLHWSLEQNNQMVFEQKEYPFKPIVEHVLYDYENLIEANDVEIETNYTKNSLIKADRESLKIVLRNLLDNSVKYMNGKGKITIEMGVDSGNYAYVSIQDTGIGISAERLAKINSLKDVSIDKINRSEGVGLGLILCQTLVKKNKGILSFDSEKGKGTKVTIQLLRSED
ncbi:tetratricopeptide repeat-containing sensor histidine kinase [Tenacibaculum sp. 190524A05c]|uniref:histidine kinase n=1 Tax=Tenacibaculum platacis TaxID=3137852 RepID=A0ABP1EM88_9FLAO